MQAAGVLQGGLERRVQVTAAFASAPAVAIYQPRRLRCNDRLTACSDGRTALKSAIQCNSDDVAAYLRSIGAPLGDSWNFRSGYPPPFGK
jgi:hypothetical protein